MSKSRVFWYMLIVCLVGGTLPGCSSIDQVAQQFSPSPSPLPTQTHLPQAGQVGQRIERAGWAITVDNALRSSLNPRERIPGNYRPDEFDYIGMDVTVERTADERGFVYGENFSLVDSSGRVYEENSKNENWVYVDGIYDLGDYGSERIVIPVHETSKELVLRFAPSPELTEPIEIALDQVKEPRHIDLREAIELGLLSADVRGMSLEIIQIDLEVSAEVEDAIELSIAPGTMFLAPTPDLQTMVVRREMVLFLTSKKELSVDLNVACANMTLKAPEGGETYIVKIEPPAEEMRKLLNLPEFTDGSFRLQQFAIWVITDNPPPGGFVGLGSGGQGSPPSTAELSQIRQWFDAAGITIQNYPSLN